MLSDIIRDYYRIASNYSLREIAARYNVPHVSLIRHFKNHPEVGIDDLPPKIIETLVDRGYFVPVQRDSGGNDDNTVPKTGEKQGVGWLWQQIPKLWEK